MDGGMMDGWMDGGMDEQTRVNRFPSSPSEHPAVPAPLPVPSS